MAPLQKPSVSLQSVLENVLLHLLVLVANPLPFSPFPAGVRGAGAVLGAEERRRPLPRVAERHVRGQREAVKGLLWLPAGVV